MAKAKRLSLWFGFAARELRSGLRGFWIFLICLVLGTSCIAIIGSLSASISRGLSEQGQQLLGGDFEVALIHRQATPTEFSALQNTGKLSLIITLRAMVSANDTTLLSEIKAVDSAYPLVGQLELQDATGAKLDRHVFDLAQGHYGVALDPLLLNRLGLKLGDSVKIGTGDFIIRATITNEPDLLSQGFLLGPRLLMSDAGLATTGLIQPGSLVTYRYRVKLPTENPTLTAEQAITTLNQNLPDAGWQIRSSDKAAQGTERFISRLSYFLTLVGLTALIIGGAGIANAVSAFLDRRLETIATLKCLGIKNSDIFAIFLCEILLVTGLGLSLSLILGAITPALAAFFLKGLLPLPLTSAIEFKPLLAAALLGLLVTISFSIWPLARTQKISATTLFRHFGSAPKSRPDWPYLLAIASFVAMIIGLCYALFNNPRLTSYYILGLSLSFVALMALAWVIIKLTKLLPKPRQLIWRYALNNISRPGSAAVSVILALGLGLTMFVALALTDNSISREFNAALPEKAPSFFFMDVKNTELAAFEQSLKHYPEVSHINAAPMLRGRIVKVKDVPVDQVKTTGDNGWALRGDRGLTYAEKLPEGSRLVAGDWWPENYTGPPLVSFVKEVADDIGLKIGDVVTVNVLGKDVVARLANLREVDWRSMNINFVMVFSPNTLKGAPHNNLVTVSMAGGNEAQLMNDITKAYPSVTAVSVKETLATVGTILTKALAAIRGANILTLLTGLMVLSGALATGLAARSYEAVVLKTYGASKAQLLAVFAIEYGILGLASALFGLLVGTAASYCLARFILEMPWVFSWGIALSTALLGMGLTIAAGLLITWQALSSSPAQTLRNE